MDQKKQIMTPEREEKVLETELPDSLIVYNIDTNQGHCLNSIAALVWKSCDGRTPLSQVGRTIEEKYNIRDGEDIVLSVLDALKKKQLLKEGAVHPEFSALISRREVVRKYIPAALVIPFIMSVTAPTRAQLTSGGSAPPQPFSGGTPELLPGLRVEGNGNIPCFIFSGSALSFLIVGRTKRRRHDHTPSAESIAKDNANIQWHIEGSYDASAPIIYGTVPKGMNAVLSAAPLAEGEIYFVESEVDAGTAPSLVTQYFRIQNGQVVPVRETDIVK